MYPFMPWWDFWHSFAPSIPVPSIYWNVRSPEQRILEMCKNMGVVFEYLASMGKTVKEMQETIDQIISGQLDPIIEQAIADWFDENEPQIVSDIADLKNADIRLDGRIDDTNTLIGELQALNDKTFDSLEFISPTISPNYVGDAIQTHQLGCCVRVGNEMHLLWGSNSASSGVGAENGIIQSFNMSTNAESQLLTDRIIGHANSVCYDSVRNCFWVAPHWTVTGSTETDVYAIYRFDAAWDNRSSFPFDFWPFAVTHDPVTQNTYMITRQGRKVGADYVSSYLYVLRPDAIDFEFFAEIPDTVDHNRELGTYQDIACYDNHFFIITTRCEMYQFMITDENDAQSCVYLRAFTVESSDAGGIWTYGEIEGMEFDANGNLYNARNNYFSSSADPAGYAYQNNGFVTQLNTKPRTLRNPYTLSGYGKNLTLSPTTVAKFKLGSGEIRNTSQVSHRLDTFARVNITGGTVTETISRPLNVECVIDIAAGATWEVMQINPYGSNITIINEGTITKYQPNPDMHTAFTTFIASNDQESQVKVNNRGTIALDASTTYFYFSRYAPNIFICSALGNLASMNINGTTITAPAMLFGSNKVTSS